MKTISKAKYLLLKLSKNYETNLKNQTVEITDEEYDNLIQYKNIKYDDNNNLEGARLVYNNYDKNKKIINIIYGQNLDTYANIEYIASSSSFFYIVFNNGTYKNIPTSELLFKLKNNIGKLKGKNNEEPLTSTYRLEYIYPNEMNSDIIQETIIASYKGLTCEFCDINVYKSDYSFNFENQKKYTGQKPNNFLNEYIDENEYSNANELQIYIDNYYITMEIRNNNGRCYYSFGSSYIIKNNEIIFLDIEHCKIKDFNFSSNNYYFEGYIEYNNETYHFLTAEFEPGNINKNTNKTIGRNVVLPRLNNNNLIIKYDLKSYHQQYCGEIFTEYDPYKQKSRWFAFTFFKDSNNYINDSYNPTEYILDPNIPEEIQQIYSNDEYDKGYLGHKTWFSQIYKNDDVDYYTYISPMYNSFNEQVWKPLMNKINLYIKSIGENNHQDLCVVVGETINNNGKKYYYVALSPTFGFESLGFYIEYKEYDENYNVDLKDFIVSIDELEQLTGIDFFCEWYDFNEGYLEQSISENLINILFNN